MDGSAATIIAAIIMLLGSMFTGFGTYYYEQWKRTKQAPSAALLLSPQEARTARIKRVAGSVLLAVDFLLVTSLIVYAWFSYMPNAVAVPNAAASCPKNAGVSFTVDSPTNNQKVERLTTMYGTACNLVKGQHAWPIVLAVTTNKYYLEGSELGVTDAHTWSRDITLGDTSESVRGHPYMVSVIIVNDATSAMLNSMISKRNTTPTITHIPPGTKVMFTITLIRK